MGFESVGLDDVDVPIVLDPRIRDWVLLPILAVMFLVALVRQWAAVLAAGDRKATPAQIQERQTLLRAERLRLHAGLLPTPTFADRRRALRSILDIRRPANAPATNPMLAQGMDQGGMVEMMKTQVLSVLPQVGLMMWVTYFFSGFVAVKLPFLLTPRFRTMLQRGMETAGLDFCYVSSLSWYVLNLLGLRGVTALVLERGDPAAASLPGASDAAMLQMQMGSAGAAPGGPPDIVKLYRAELENLDLVTHTFDLDTIETRLLGPTIGTATTSTTPRKPRAK